MGLIIKPKSKYRAFLSYVLGWKSAKKAFHNEPIVIAWDCISEILVISNPKITQYIIAYTNPDGYSTTLTFFTDEVQDLTTFESYLTANPHKVRVNSLHYFREQMFDSMGLYLRYSAVTAKFTIGLLAMTFMFFQFKYFGTLLIQKYQFLIRSSCNQQCAETLWSLTTVFMFALLMTCAPLIPFLFYKKLRSTAAKSKNVQVINTTIIETALITIVGLTLLIETAPRIHKSTTQYSKVLVSYSNGSLQAKLTQKIEMASKRQFQGDTEDSEESEVLQDQHEE